MFGEHDQASHPPSAVARKRGAASGGRTEPAVEALDAPHAPDGRAGESPEHATVVRFVNEILATAIRERASDIHFEPFEQEFRVRCRVDGALRETAAPPLALSQPVISRL